MGLQVLDKKIQFFKNEIEVSKDYLNISNLIIPFSIFFRNNSPSDIYSGEETMTFKERDSIFQQILIYEFLSE
ncbi:MAG: hypothetical protein ACFFB6_12430 [Promethearchaeota archaeon]